MFFFLLYRVPTTFIKSFLNHFPMYSLQYNPNLYYMKTTLQQIFGAFTFLHHSVTLLFPLRHIKQTHLPLYHLLFHPPREHILRRLPLRLPPPAWITSSIFPNARIYARWKVGNRRNSVHRFLPAIGQPKQLTR